MSTQIAYSLLIGALVLERLFELRLSSRNRERVFPRGGVEYGLSHFKWMQALHTGFFIAALAEVWLAGSVAPIWLSASMLLLVVLAQGLRYWAIITLGDRWNVRVLVEPQVPAVTRGPYRYLRHPNYLAVVIEGIAIPLIHGAWLTAVLFTLLNAILLRVRIGVEEQALEQHSNFELAFAQTKRRLPRALLGGRAEPGAPGSGGQTTR